MQSSGKSNADDDAEKEIIKFNDIEIDGKVQKQKNLDK